MSANEDRTRSATAADTSISPLARVLLQPGRGVDGVADHRVVEALDRARADRAREHLAGVNADRDRRVLPVALDHDSLLGAQDGAHGVGRVHRASRVVLTSKDRHHGVPDELVDDAAALRDRDDDVIEVVVEQLHHLLARPRSLAQGREPTDVEERDGRVDHLRARQVVGRRLAAEVAEQPRR